VESARVEMAGHEDELCAALTRMALAGDGLVLGIGMTVLAVRTWMKLWSHTKALKDVKETPLTRIADLRTLVEGEGGGGGGEQQQQQQQQQSHREKSSILEKQTKPFPQEPEVFATKNTVRMPARPWMGPPPSTSLTQAKQEKLVIVRGKVQTRAYVETEDSKPDGDALVALNVPEKAVYIERTQTCLYNKWRGISRLGSYSRGLWGWGSLKEQVSLTKSKVPFVLADAEARWNHKIRDNAFYVHINMEDSRHALPLVTVYHQLHPVPASSYTLLQAMFGRRYPVGLLDEEKILPLGAEVTAVGVLSTTSDGSVVIKSCKRLPMFLTELTREQLLIELANGTKVLFWMGLAVSTVAAGVLGYSILKNWTKWKQRQQQRQRQNDHGRQERIADEEADNLEEVPDGELCAICLLRRRRAAFIYCGHRVCCVTCAQRVEQGTNPKCPVCRQEVTGFVRVYDS